MSRTSRLLVLLYALAMLAQAAGSYAASPSDLLTVWSFSGAVAAAYLVLALGYIFSRKITREPSLPWLAAALVFILTLWSETFFKNGSPTPDDLKNIPQYTGPWIVFIAVSISLYFALRKGKGTANPASSRMFLVALWAVGAVFVALSLVLDITDDATGWQVVLRRAPWITQYHNVATSDSDPSIEWLQPIYGNAGYIVYLLALVLTLAVALWLVVALARLKGWQSSRALASSAALFTFLVFWLYTDIFWGWHSLVPESRWSALLCTALWLAAPLFVLAYLAPVSLRQGETARLRTLLVLQLPVAAFNYATLPTYFSSASGGPSFPGLGTLMMGLQLQSWACIALFTFASNKAEGSAC